MLVFGKKAHMVKRARLSKTKSLRQARLKTELGLQAEEETVVVEKSNMVKFFVSKAEAILGFAACAGIRGLAITGLAALIYPAPRQEMLLILTRLMEELTGYLRKG